MTQLLTHNGYYLWNYVPSKAAAIIFVLLFICTTSLHTWRMFKTKSWFCTAFTIGCFFEIIGYIGRAAAYSRTDKIMPYVIQNLFILLAPTLFAASIYMTLGRIIRCVHGEDYSVVPIKWLTKLFVCGDVLSFMVQGGAAGLMVTGSNTKMGENMVVGGLLIQIISFGLFGVTAVIFHLRIRRNPTKESYEVDSNWQQYLRMLYVVSSLVMVRSIFRVVEYVSGQTGYPLKHEWTLYIFDSTLMFAVTVIFYLRYPSKLQQSLGDIRHVRLNEINPMA